MSSHTIKPNFVSPIGHNWDKDSESGPTAATMINDILCPVPEKGTCASKTVLAFKARWVALNYVHARATNNMVITKLNICDEEFEDTVDV